MKSFLVHPIPTTTTTTNTGFQFGMFGASSPTRERNNGA
jgi:hypothetical protein